MQPTRTAIRTWISRIAPRAVPIRSCSRWGLPCRFRRRKRGALLPHRFTLAALIRNARGGLFSVALSLGSLPACAGRCPAGRYPAPYVHGARTFLPGDLSVLAGAAVRPTDPIGMGEPAPEVKGRAIIWFRCGSTRSRAIYHVGLEWSPLSSGRRTASTTPASAPSRLRRLPCGSSADSRHESRAARRGRS